MNANDFIRSNYGRLSQGDLAVELGLTRNAVRCRIQRMGLDSLSPIEDTQTRHPVKQPSHYFIPDNQVKPGVPLDHLRWIGKHILDRKPNIVISIGDFWDMPSLSSYDRGKKSFEGRRVTEDIKVGNEAFRLLTQPTRDYNRGRSEELQYHPRWVFLYGNHEHRISRAAEDSPEMDGLLDLNMLDTTGWETHNFLDVVWIDGVAYSHYFYNPMNGRPYGGDNIKLRLKNIGHSFSMGHQQTLDYGLRFVGGKSHHGLVAGACYLHDEDYKGPQGNAHWRGVVVKHDVHDGQYNPMFVNLDYLCRRYEGIGLDDFLAEKYYPPTQGVWLKRDPDKS